MKSVLRHHANTLVIAPTASETQALNAYTMLSRYCDVPSRPYRQEELAVLRQAYEGFCTAQPQEPYFPLEFLLQRGAHELSSECVADTYVDFYSRKISRGLATLLPADKSVAERLDRETKKPNVFSPLVGAAAGGLYFAHQSQDLVLPGVCIGALLGGLLGFFYRLGQTSCANAIMQRLNETEAGAQNTQQNHQDL